MSERLRQLQELQAQLHEINQDFARSALPLEHLREMNGEQRQKLADQLRAAQERWEAVTREIARVLQPDGAGGR